MREHDPQPDLQFAAAPAKGQVFDPKPNLSVRYDGREETPRVRSVKPVYDTDMRLRLYELGYDVGIDQKSAHRSTGRERP